MAEVLVGKVMTVAFYLCGFITKTLGVPEFWASGIVLSFGTRMRYWDAVMVRVHLSTEKIDLLGQSQAYSRQEH